MTYFLVVEPSAAQRIDEGFARTVASWTDGKIRFLHRETATHLLADPLTPLQQAEKQKRAFRAIAANMEQTEKRKSKRRR